MFKSLQEIQEFIKWCSANGVRSVSVGDISVDFWTLELPEGQASAALGEERDTTKTLLDGANEVTDEDLFFSAQ